MSTGVSSRTGASADIRAGVPVGIHIAGGAVVVVIGALVASAVPSMDGGWRLAAVALAVGLFAGKTKDAVACAAVVVLAWLVVNGFLVDRLGELSWHGSADLVRVAVLAAAAGAGLAIGKRTARSSDRSIEKE